MQSAKPGDVSEYLVIDVFVAFNHLSSINKHAVLSSKASLYLARVSGIVC